MRGTHRQSHKPFIFGVSNFANPNVSECRYVFGPKEMVLRPIGVDWPIGFFAYLIGMRHPE